MSKRLDLEYGLKKEDEVLPIIREYFKRDISKATDKYSKYDYKDDIYKYELKSRKNSINTYPTVLINADKANPNTYLLFNFTDGLYYIKFRPIRFSKFERKLFQRSYRREGNDYKNDVIYIPINKLKKIT